MRTKIVAGNWKMNNTLPEGLAFMKELHHLLLQKKHGDAMVLIFPPFIHLSELCSAYKNSIFGFGAQNLHEKDKGAFTGEISASMIHSTGAAYVLVGHSERRQYFGETNQILNQKLQIAFQNKLNPVYCCGETIDERNSGKLFEVVKEQIETGLSGLTEENLSKLIIAYEPVWAIGTGVVATPDQAQEMHHYIRELIRAKFGITVANNISILYGGSVKSSNAAELFNLPDVDGGLVGGASLIATEFHEIINAC